MLNAEFVKKRGNHFGGESIFW